MTGVPTLDHKLARAVLPTLFVEEDPEKSERVGESGLILAEDSGRDLLAVLELHGVLPLVWRNLSAEGVPFSGVNREQFEERDRANRAHAERSQLTLDRFVGEAKKSGLEVLLLKGASLVLDVYPDPALRPQGDVDVLLRENEVAEAVRAAGRCGLVLNEGQFPAWWYRLVHFHLKLHPAVSLLTELEIHWRLQSPALLLTPALESLFARSRQVECRGEVVGDLDPFDRFMHLSTHLMSHWRNPPPGDVLPVVCGILTDPAPPIRLKWLVDLGAALNLLSREFPDALSILVDRSREWNGEKELAAALRFTLATPVSNVAADLADRILAKLGGEGASFPSSVSAAKVPPLVELPRPHDDLDFRIDALSLLPRWVFPPRIYLAREYGCLDRWPRLLYPPVRAGHAVVVLARTFLALFLFPFAWSGRSFLARSRRDRKKEALSPDAVLDLVVEWKGKGGQAEERGKDSQ